MYFSIKLWNEQFFQTISPVDGTVYLERPFAEKREIEKKLVKAAQSQEAWQSASIAQRATICRKVS